MVMIEDDEVDLMEKVLRKAHIEGSIQKMLPAFRSDLSRYFEQHGTNCRSCHQYRPAGSRRILDAGGAVGKRCRKYCGSIRPWFSFRPQKRLGAAGSSVGAVWWLSYRNGIWVRCRCHGQAGGKTFSKPRDARWITRSLFTWPVWSR